MDRVSGVAVDAVGDEGVAFPYPQGPRVVAFQGRLCGDSDQESGYEGGCLRDVRGGFQCDEGGLEVPGGWDEEREQPGDEGGEEEEQVLLLGVVHVCTGFVRWFKVFSRTIRGGEQRL